MSIPENAVRFGTLGATFEGVRKALDWLAARGEYSFLALLILAFGFALGPLLGLWLPPVGTAVAVAIPFVLIFIRASLKFHQLEEDIGQEQRCLSEFIGNAETLWSALRQSPTKTIEKQNILDLSNQHLRQKALHAKMLIEEISNAKMYMLESSNETILRYHKETLDGRLRDLNSYGGLSIKVGILGTFIGFLLAIFALGKVFSGISPEAGMTGVATNLQDALQDLAFKFISSIYGLLVAIIISVQTTNGRSSLNKLYKQFDDVLSFGREFINRMSLADPVIHSSLIQVKNALEKVEQRFYDHGFKVEAALQAHAQVVNDEAERFAQAAEGLIDAQKQWDTFFTKLKEIFSAVEASTTSLTLTVERGFSQAAEKFGATVAELKAEGAQLRNAGEACLQVSAESDAKWDGRIGSLVQNLDQHQKEYSAWARGTHDTLKEIGEGLGAFSQILNTSHMSLDKNTEAHASSTVTLTNTVKKINQQSDETLENTMRTLGVFSEKLDSNSTFIGKNIEAQNSLGNAFTEMTKTIKQIPKVDILKFHLKNVVFLVIMATTLLVLMRAFAPSAFIDTNGSSAPFRSLPERLR